MSLKSSEYKVGLKIKAKDRTGKWYLASLLEIDEEDKDVCVHFEGWHHRHDEWVEFDSDRLRPLTPTTIRQLEPEKWKPKVGQEVRARWIDRRLYLGKILKVHNNGTYDVKFKDGFKLEVDYEDLRPVKPIQKGFIKFREPLKLEDESSPSNPTGSGSISKEDEKGKESKRQSSSKEVKVSSSASKSTNKTQKAGKEQATNIPPKTKTPKHPLSRQQAAEKTHSRHRSSSCDSISSRLSLSPRNNSIKSLSPADIDPKPIRRAIKRRRIDSDSPEPKSRSSTPEAKKLRKSPRGEENKGAALRKTMEGKSRRLRPTDLENKEKKNDSKVSPASKRRGKDGSSSDGNRQSRRKKGYSGSDTVKESGSRDPQGISSSEDQSATESQTPIVSISTSKRKAYTPQHKSSLPSSPCHTPGPPLLIDLSTPVLPSNTRDSEKKMATTEESQVTTRKLQLASPTFTPKKKLKPDFDNQTEKDSSVRLELTKEVQPLEADRELSSSGYKVSILDIESTRTSADMAVIVIDPVKVAPERYTRQQTKNFGEKSGLLKEPIEIDITQIKESPPPKEEESDKESEAADATPTTASELSEPSDTKETEEAVPIRRLQTTLVPSEPPKARLRSRSLRDPGQRRVRLRSETDGSKLAIPNVKKFKRATGLDLLPVNARSKPQQEVVINLDHNDFKCKAKGCTKSFRKETLLLWHMKHYHPGVLKTGKSTPAIPGVKDRLKGGVTPPTRTEGAPARPRKSSHGKSEEATSGKKSCATKGNRDEEGATRSTTTKKNEATTQKTSSASPLPGEPIQVSPHTPIIPGITPIKPTLGRPPKKQLSNEGQTGGANKPVLSPVGETPSKKIKLIDSVEKTKLTESDDLDKDIPKVVPKQTVRKWAARSRINDNSDSEFLPSDESGDGSQISFKSESSNSLSFASLDIGHELTLIDDEDQEDHLLNRGWVTPEPVLRGRVYNRYCSGHKDDVIHCLCGSFKEEGFMIQCEQCFAWQHGECVGVDAESPPEDYICFICSNPQLLRRKSKYQLDRMWFGSGKVMSAPSQPSFPFSEEVLKANRLADELLRLRDIHQSLKLLFQMACEPDHLALSHWSPNSSEITEHLKVLLAEALAHVPNDIAPDESMNCTHSSHGNSPPDSHGNSPDNQEKDALICAKSCDGHTERESVLHSDNSPLKEADFKQKDESHDYYMTITGRDYSASDVGVHAVAESTISTHSTKSLPPLPPQSSELYSGPTQSTSYNSDECLATKSSITLRPLPPLPPEPVAVRSETAGDVSSCHVPVTTSESVNLVVPSQQNFASQSFDIHCPIPVRSSGSEHQTSGPRPPLVAGILAHRSQEESPFKPIQSCREQEQSINIRGIEAPSLSPDFACISPPVDESGSGMQTVPIATYADAFVRSDPDNWCARMMLVDHISHVQEKICKRMMVIEKEIEDLPEVESITFGREGSTQSHRRLMEDLLSLIQTDQPKLVV